jgi:hypothetical protein
MHRGRCVTGACFFAESQYATLTLSMSALQDVLQTTQPGQMHCILMALLC